MKILLLPIIVLLIIAVDHTVATETSRPVLHDAIVKENLDLLRQLLSTPDIDVNMKDHQEASPLHFAALTGLKYVQLLLDQPSIDVNSRDKHGLTPLHYTVAMPKSFSAKVIKALLDHGADIEAVGSDQKVTPLHLAVMADKTALVQVLVDRGAKVNAQSVSGQTALHGAVTKRNPDLLRALLTSKSFKFSDYTQHYELIANALPYPAVVRTLFEFGFDPKARGTEFNSTLLHLAATLGSLESVQVLHEFNADINARDVWLKTPLHYAVYNKHNHIARYLLDHGADHQLQDDAGIAPYDEAVQANNQEMIDLLKSLDSEEKIEL